MRRELVLVLVLVLATLASCTEFDGLHARPRDGGADGADGSPLARYEDEVARDHPLASWHFDDGTGATATDATGQGHDCNYVGGVIRGAQGPLGSAIELDGSHAFVQCTDAPFDFTGVAPFSLEAVVMPTRADTIFRKIVSKDDPNGGTRRGFNVHVAEPAHVAIERFENGKQLCATGVPITLGVYSHVVAVFDGAKVTISSNGTAASVACTPTPLSDHALPLTVGVQSDGHYGFFVGRIDEVAVYDTALDPTRIAAHAAASKILP